MRKFAALLVALAFAGTTMIAFAADDAKPADKPAAEKKHAKKAKKEAPMKEAPAAAPAAPAMPEKK